MSSVQPREAAIIGMGAITPAGSGVKAFAKALFAGESQFADISLFDASGHRTGVGAELVLPDYHPCRLDEKLLGRTDIVGLAAAHEALNQAGLLDAEGRVTAGAKTALVCATAGGAILGLEAFFRHRHYGESADSRQLLTSFCLSALATNIAKEFQISGPRTTTATVCSSSGVSMAVGLEMLRERSDIDYVVVAASEALCEVTHGGFNALRSVAPDCCRPFAEDRQGLVLGEAGSALVLCRPDKAGKEAPCFSGYGLSTDLYHFTAPDPKGGASRFTLEEALADGQALPAEIDYINCHGTGTPKNDEAEVQGIKNTLGERSKEIPLSSTKSMFGHTLGAASLLEAIATVLALDKQAAPPTAHLHNQDPELDLNFTPLASQPAPIKTALSNSFAFGGSNVSLVLKKSCSRQQGGKKEQGAHAVITGIGIVSPLGVGCQSFIKSLDQGDSGLCSFAEFGEEWQEYQGGIVDMAAVRQGIEPRRRRRLNRLGSFLTVAVNEALAQAGLVGEDLNDAHLAYGSAFGCSSNVHNFYTQLLNHGATAASPQDFMLSVTNAPAALVAQHLGVQGPVWVFVEDEVSWEVSLHWAVQLIETGRAKRVIVAAADEISDSIIAIHGALGFLDQPGYHLGEGAVAMVLEGEEEAERRAVSPLGVVGSCLSSQDVSCDPMTFSRDAGLIAQSVQNCLGDRERASLEIFGPENGIVDEVARQALDGVLSGDSGKNVIRSRAGDSGLGGGLALAAGLLSSQDINQVLTLSMGRGGVQATTLVERRGGQ
ncbi:MAG: beta-ketoacyl-[acyl-carrier-protein] synthase family protein [Thermodesulfobacteriota bacterium]